MPEEVSSIGVKLTLDAGGYMAGMAKATERTDAFVASVEKASTVAGGVGGGGKAAKSLPAQKIPVDLTISAGQLGALRKQIIAGIGVIPIQVTAQMSKAARAEAQSVVSAVSVPAVGTRSGATTAVASTVRRNMPTRATGGPVRPGQDYLVGERGPEVFRPDRPGNIHPNMHGGGYAHRAAGGDVFAKYAAELTAWKKNLLAHAKGISPELAKSARHWYEIAHAQALGDLADFGRPGSDVNVGAFAAASPGQAWPSNRAILREILAKGMHGSKTINQDVPGFGMTQATAPYGYGNWTKAAQILKTGSIAGLSGPKVTPFFANLSGRDPEAWTLDARQMRIASANALTSAPGGGSWQRKVLERAHEDVYPELQRMWGVTHRSQAQAVLWAGYGRGEDLGTDFERTTGGILIPRHPGIKVPFRKAGGAVKGASGKTRAQIEALFGAIPAVKMTNGGMLDYASQVAQMPEADRQALIDDVFGMKDWAGGKTAKHLGNYLGNNEWMLRPGALAENRARRMARAGIPTKDQITAAREAGATDPREKAMRRFGLRAAGPEEEERLKRLYAEDEARAEAQRQADLVEIPKFHPKKTGKTWEVVHENGHTKMMVGDFATAAEAQAAIDKALASSQKASKFGPSARPAQMVAAAVIAPVAVPHVKSPEQLEHERIAEAGMARREERMAALETRVMGPRGGGGEYPPSTIAIATKRAEVAQERALLERARKSGLFLRRQKGGSAGEGLYIVNEAGPEAFLTAHDAGRLGQRRPDIMAGIGDGSRTGMINKPAWSMFAPQQDGMIVPAHLAKAALGAVRAAEGTWVGGSTGPIITPGGFTPTGPIVQTAGAKFELAAAIKAVDAFTASILSATQATKFQITAGQKATQQLTAGAIRMGPGTVPPVNALPAGQGVIFQGGVGEPAVPEAFHAKARAAVEASGIFSAAGAQAATRAKAAPVGPAVTQAATRSAQEAGHASDAIEASEGEWVAVGKGLQARGDKTAQAARELLSAGAKPKELLESFLARGPGGQPQLRRMEGVETPIGLEADEMQALRFGHVAARSERIRTQGGPTPIEQRMEELRVSTAGAAAFESTRNPRGVAAVLGQLLGGGGLEFKRRQVELQSAQQQWRARANEVIKLQNEVQAHEKGINLLRQLGVPTAGIEARMAEKQTDLAAAEETHAQAVTKLERAEKAVQPTTLNVIRSFGSIIAATAAYGLAFAAANAIIEKAVIPTVQRLGDELLGFGPTMTKVTTSLAESTHAAAGNVQAVLAQASATAGLSGPMMDYVGDALTASIDAKAAAKAQQETSDLFRASLSAQRGQAPEGLYGGFGGILGTSLFGEQMGGGRGFTEIIAQDLQKAGGMEGALTTRSINDAVTFATNKSFRDVFVQRAIGTGRPESSALETVAQGLDFLPKIAEQFATPAPYEAMPVFGPLLASTLPQLVGSLIPPTPAAMGYGGAGQAAGEAPILFGKTEVERTGVVKYLDDLGASAKRGAEANEHATVGTYELTTSQAEMSDAMMTAFAAGDAPGLEMARLGVVLKDANDHVITDLDDYRQAVEDMAKGKGIVPPEVWAKQNMRQLQAQQQALGMQAERQINVEIPIEAFKGLLQAPIIAPGAGFFPSGPGRGRAAGLTGPAAGMAGAALRETGTVNVELQKMATAGLEQARADIAQFTPEKLPDFNAAVKDAQGASSAIARLTSNMASLNRQASQASWGNQIRLANRAYGDALGLLREGGTRFGQLSRQQYDISRQSQALQLALQQRQITTQVALAGFQAPGETGEERYMRQKEKLAEADIAQQQLGFSFRDFTISGTLWKMNAERAATDAAAAINVMQRARNAEGYAIAAQETIAKRQQQLGQSVARIDALLSASRGAWSGAVQAAVQGIGQFSGALNTAVREIYQALGYNVKRGKGGRLTITGEGLPNTITPSSAGRYGTYATGYLGGFAKGATFTVGEAGPETVAILRNPRTHMLGGGGEGGGNNTIHVNVNGPVVRDDKDIAELARCVAEEVERALSRKGQLLGLRSPAY